MWRSFVHTSFLLSGAMAENDGAASLVFFAHGAVLRLVCQLSGRHFSGLEEASRFLRMHWQADARLVRRLRHLDHAFAMVRHISAVSVQELLGDVSKVAANSHAQPQLHRVDRCSKQRDTSKLERLACLRASNTSAGSLDGPCGSSTSDAGTCENSFNVLEQQCAVTRHAQLQGAMQQAPPDHQAYGHKRSLDRKKVNPNPTVQEPPFLPGVGGGHGFAEPHRDGARRRPRC